MALRRMGGGCWGGGAGWRRRRGAGGGAMGASHFDGGGRSVFGAAWPRLIRVPGIDTHREKREDDGTTEKPAHKASTQKPQHQRRDGPSGAGWGLWAISTGLHACTIEKLRRCGSRGSVVSPPRKAGGWEIAPGERPPHEKERRRHAATPRQPRDATAAKRKERQREEAAARRRRNGHAARS